MQFKFLKSVCHSTEVKLIFASFRLRDYQTDLLVFECPILCVFYAVRNNLIKNKPYLKYSTITRHHLIAELTGYGFEAGILLFWIRHSFDFERIDRNY